MSWMTEQIRLEQHFHTFNSFQFFFSFRIFKPSSLFLVVDSAAYSETTEAPASHPPQASTLCMNVLSPLRKNWCCPWQRPAPPMAPFSPAQRQSFHNSSFSLIAFPLLLGLFHQYSKFCYFSDVNNSI